MTDSIARIDPALPLCWEDPQTLRFGFDHAEVRIPQPSAATQRLLGALRQGLPVAALTQVSQQLGATAAERRELLELVAPVLLPESPALGAEAGRPADRPPLRIAVSGAGEAAEHLHAVIARAGWAPTKWGGPTLADDGGLPADVDLCIVVERFMAPPSTFLALSGTSLPHLSVRFTDRSVRIGPLVLPGRTPCVNCVALAEVDADPGLPLLATQLSGQAPAAESPMSAALAAALVLSFVHRWQTGSPWPHHAQLRLAVAEGLPALVPAELRVRHHPACVCATATPSGYAAEPASTRPASAMKRDGERTPRPRPAVPDRRS